MMRTIKNFRAPLLGALVTLALSACGANVEVKGKVSDGSGSQTQGLTRGFTGLGGAGTASAATRVSANAVTSSGGLTVIAEADVKADGSYAITLPEDSTRVVFQAIDANGQVLASGLLDAAVGGEAGVRQMAPITSESSLEAEVFLRIVADGTAPEAVDTVDLRTRLDARIGAEVASLGEDASARSEAVVALATSVRAAQEARVRAYAKAGVTVTQEELFESSLRASAKLDAALAAGTANEAAWTAFWAEVRSSTEKTDEKTESEAERAASVSFRASVKAQLGADSAITDAAVRTAATIEARASEAAVTAVLESANASQAVIDASIAAGVKLRADIAAAADADAVAQAWTTWSTSIATSSNTSVLGAFVETNVAGQATLQASITATATASAALDLALGAAIEAGNPARFETVVTGIVDAYATFNAAVRAQATALATFGARASPSVEILLVAQGSFHLR